MILFFVPRVVARPSTLSAFTSGGRQAQQLLVTTRNAPIVANCACTPWTNGSMRRVPCWGDEGREESPYHSRSKRHSRGVYSTRRMPACPSSTSFVLYFCLYQVLQYHHYGVPYLWLAFPQRLGNLKQAGAVVTVTLSCSKLPGGGIRFLLTHLSSTPVIGPVVS